MSVEQNKAAVRRFFAEVLDQGSVEAEAEVFTDDCIRRFPGITLEGRVGARTGRTRTPARTFHTTIHHLFGEGDLVAARITHEVTFDEDFASFARVGPVPAAGRSITWDATVIFRLHDGKIAEEWVNRDELGMLLQLGAEIRLLSTEC